MPSHKQTKKQIIKHILEQSQIQQRRDKIAGKRIKSQSEFGMRTKTSKNARNKSCLDETFDIGHVSFFDYLPNSIKKSPQRSKMSHTSTT